MVTGPREFYFKLEDKIFKYLIYTILGVEGFKALKLENNSFEKFLDGQHLLKM